MPFCSFHGNCSHEFSHFILSCHVCSHATTALLFVGIPVSWCVPAGWNQLNHERVCCC
jgi:hypothetical protein